ncbi:unnamed protein product, partial [Rotaria sp. Silwood1]
MCSWHIAGGWPLIFYSANGFLSALPYIVLWLCTHISGIIAD